MTWKAAGLQVYALACTICLLLCSLQIVKLLLEKSCFQPILFLSSLQLQVLLGFNSSFSVFICLLHNSCHVLHSSKTALLASALMHAIASHAILTKDCRYLIEVTHGTTIRQMRADTCMAIPWLCASMGEAMSCMSKLSYQKGL